MSNPAPPSGTQPDPWIDIPAIREKLARAEAADSQAGQ
jgi:hypothetical protein